MVKFRMELYGLNFIPGTCFMKNIFNFEGGKILGNSDKIEKSTSDFSC